MTEVRVPSSAQGGVRAGSGRPRADSLDPAVRCTFTKTDGIRCGNAMVAGSADLRHDGEGRCRWHGGLTREVLAAQKSAVVDRVLPGVTVADFPQVAAEYVAALNQDFADRRSLLAELREGIEIVDDSPQAKADFLREYADIAMAQERTALVVTKVMDSAAKLGIAGAAWEDVKLRTANEVGAMLVDLLDELLAGLDLTPGQEDTANTLVPRLLRSWSTRR